MAVYDTIGTTYSRTRRPDPRIAAKIRAALGDAESVINVGAGTGSYEPGQTVLAVEPSAVMVAQRPQGAAPAVRAVAERLPVRDGAADAVLAVLTVHHWTDLAAGVAELRRAARRRVVVLAWDQTVTRDLWLLREYFPQGRELDDRRAVPVDELAALLGGARVETVPVPHDCTDGFGAAFWRRPHAYLDPQVQAGMSVLAQLTEAERAQGLNRLAADLDSGKWQRRHADLLGMESVDAGYRLLVADVV